MGFWEIYYTSLITLGTGLIAVLLTIQYSERRERTNLFNQAAEKFRVGFSPVITKLARLNKPIPLGGLIIEALNEGHDQRILEKNELSLHLKGRKLRRFEAAWKEYCHPCHDDEKFKGKPIFVFGGYLIAAERQGMDAAKALAVKKIGKLLSFTMPR